MDGVWLTGNPAVRRHVYCRVSHVLVVNMPKGALMPRLVFERSYETDIVGFLFYASIGNRRIRCVVGREDVSDTFGLTDRRSEDRQFNLEEAHIAA
jgi:hypothetical protein